MEGEKKPPYLHLSLLIVCQILTTQLQVLLLEAGDEAPQITDVPGLLALLQKSSVDYMYKSQPEPITCQTQNQKKCEFSSGKMMGGSSSMNVKLYARGSRQDYDDWASFGNTGWSWDEVLPYFKKSEDQRNWQVRKFCISKQIGNIR